MPKLYFRCNSGHYFDSVRCPYDGWAVRGAGDVLALVGRLAEGDRTLSISRLRDEGVPEDVLSRVLLIEFGSDESAFEALDPAGYVVHGQAVPIRSAGPSLR